MTSSNTSARGITLKGMSEIMAIGHEVAFQQDLESLKVGVVGIYQFSDTRKHSIFIVKKYRGESNELLVEYRMTYNELPKPDSITPFFLLLLTVLNILFYNYVTIVPSFVRGGLILILLGMTHNSFMKLSSGEREREFKEKMEIENRKITEETGDCKTFYYSL